MGRRRPKYYLYIDGCYSKKGPVCSLNNKALNRLLDYARTTSENISFIFQYLGSCTKKYAHKNKIPHLQVSCEVYKRLFYECFSFISSNWYTLLIDVSLFLLASSGFTVRCIGLDLFATFYAIPINVSQVSRTVSQGRKLTTSSLQYIDLPLDRSEAVATFLRNNQERLLRGINSLAASLTRFNPALPFLDMLAIHFASTLCFLWLYFTYCTLLLNVGETSTNYRNLAGALLVAYTMSKNVGVLDNLAGAIQVSINSGQILLQRNVEILLDYYNLYNRVLNNALSNKDVMLRGPMATPRGLPSSFTETEKGTPWSNLVTVLECSAGLSTNVMVVNDINFLFDKDRVRSFPEQGVLCYWRLIIKSLSLVFQEQVEDATKPLLTEDKSSTSLMLIEKPASILDSNASRVLALFSKTRTEILFRLINSVSDGSHVLVHASSIFHWIQHHILTSRVVSATMLRLLVLELVKFRQMCLLAGTNIQISNVYLHGIATVLLMDCPYILFNLILAMIMSQQPSKDIEPDVVRQLFIHCAEPDTLEAGFLADFLIPADAEKVANDSLLSQMRDDISSIAVELLGALPYLNNELSRIFLKRLYKLLYHLRTFFFTIIVALEPSVQTAYDTFLSKIHDMLLQHAMVIVSFGFSNAQIQLDVILKTQVNNLSFSTEVERREVPQCSTDRLRDEPSNQSKCTAVRQTNKHNRFTSTLTNMTLYDRRVSCTDDADLLSFTSLQSLQSKCSQYDSRPYIFECIKASRFWEVLIKVTSSCFHDRLSGIKYGVDHLVTDFLCCSSFRALVAILHESSPSNRTCYPTLTVRRPSSSAHAHPDSPFESNITNSAFFHDASINLFEQVPFQDHETSVGVCHNTGDPNDTTDNAGSSLSLGKSTTSVIGSQAVRLSAYLTAVSVASIEPQVSSQSIRDEPHHTLVSVTKNREPGIDTPQAFLTRQETCSLESTRLRSPISIYTLIATILSEATLMKTLLSCVRGQTIFYLLLIYSNLMGDVLRLNENQGGFLSIEFWKAFSHLVGNLLTGGTFTHRYHETSTNLKAIPVFLLYEYALRSKDSKQIVSDHDSDLGFASAPMPSVDSSLDELETFRNVLFMDNKIRSLRPYALSIFERVLEELPKTSSYDILPHIIHTIYPDTVIPLPLGYTLGIILASSPAFDETPNAAKWGSIPLSSVSVADQIPSSFPFTKHNTLEKSSVSNATLDEGYFSDYGCLSTIKKDMRIQPYVAPSKSIYESVTQLRRSISTVNNASFAVTKSSLKKSPTRYIIPDSVLQMSGRANDDNYISRSLLTGRDTNHSHLLHGNSSLSASARGSVDKLFSVEALQENVILIARTYVSLVTVISLSRTSGRELINDLYVKVPLSTIALWIFHNKTVSGDSILACFVILFIYICGRDPPDDNALFLAFQRPPLQLKKDAHTGDFSFKVTLPGPSPTVDSKPRHGKWTDMFELSEVKAFITELCKRYRTLRHFFRTNVSKLLSVLFEALYKHAELSGKLDSYVIDGLSTLSSRMTVCCSFLDCTDRAHLETLILSTPPRVSWEELLHLAEKLSKLRVSSAEAYFKQVEDSKDCFNFSEEAKIIRSKLMSGSIYREDKPITLSRLYFDYYLLPGMVVKRMLVDQLSCVGTLITQPSVEFVNSSSLLLDKNFPTYVLPDKWSLINEMLSKAAKLPFNNPLYILSILTGLELTFQLSGELYAYANLQITEVRHTQTTDKAFPQVTPRDAILSSISIEANNYTLAQETYAFILNFGSQTSD
ncbi:Hypothetical protein GLP15_3351 [Giardia lamblia P15]|uniref:Uncharacterized protein n=1 Tax=Giardia intestinalis (strain P15) TaxID=658858 RepID=E1EVU9_GIAIA|nr:Hypothetical protein GLP15_3351 [Giardia lamblia P15]